MPSEDTQFKSGNGGRPKGTVNRKTKIAAEFAQSFLKDTDLQDAIRLILSNPNHEHFRWILEMMMAYAYGLPKEHVHQTSDGSLPAHQFNIAWLDYDKFFLGEKGCEEYVRQRPHSEGNQ